MKLLRAFRLGLRGLLNQDSRSRELDEELSGFLEASTQEKMRRGMSHAEATRAARVEMGSMETVKQKIHSYTWESLVESTWQDVRYGMRQLVRSPGFFVVAVLTLALGIGANTAIFTLVHAVMLKQLPVANPSALYRVGEGEYFCCEWGGLEGDWGTFDYPFYKHLRDTSPAFEQVAAFSGNTPSFNVRRAFSQRASQPGSETTARTINGEYVSGNYFATLGIGAIAGRLLGPADDEPGAPAAVVLGYREWQEHYASDPSIVGSTLLVNNLPVTLVGIAPRGFFGDRLSANPPALWIPLNQFPVFSGQGKNSLVGASGDGAAWLYVIGRLRPGYAPTQVSAGLTLDIRQWLKAHRQLNADDLNDLPRQHIQLTPGGTGISPFRSSSRSGLYLLSAASALVLLIACANLANLLLARSAARQQQTALRLSLGAPRSRLMRALLTESVLLSTLGGGAGLFVAYAGTRAILLIAFRGATFIPVNAAPSLPVLAFAMLLSIATGVLFGVVPAWIGTHAQAGDGLRGSRTTTVHASRPQKALVVIQAALSVVLLAVAGLVTESLRNLESTSLGFEPEGRLLATINFKAAGYEVAQLPALYEDLQQRLERIPGVLSASLALNSPQNLCCVNLSIDIAGRNDKWIEDVNVLGSRVTPHYFETIGTPLLLGRALSWSDTQASTHVAVVDQAFVQKFFAQQNPIGQHFGLTLQGHAADYEIVGVVGTAKYKNPTAEQSPAYFVPFTQTVAYVPTGYQRLESGTLFAQTIALHVAGEPEGYESILRQVLAGVDPNLSPDRIQSYSEQIAVQFNQERLMARLTGLFSMLALLLASIGLYGVTAYNVARRTGEIGIRMALGANRGNVVRMVLRGALAQVGLGLAIGFPLAILCSRYLAHQLYGVSRFDPLVLSGAMLVLSLCTLIAGMVPARRAARIQPMEALRIE